MGSTTRQKSEFNLERLFAQVRHPTTSSGVYSWSLPAIMAARDAQLQGKFKLPARMAESMRTDDALFVAKKNRLAPQQAIGYELKAAQVDGGDIVAEEAAPLFGPGGTAIRPSTLNNIHCCLADHGFAVGYNVLTPRADGSRVDIELRAWPIEHVEWDPTQRQLTTYTYDDPRRIPIVHGDGRWVVFANYDIEPWKQDACILPAAIVWARHAYAARDWSKGSAAYGNTKVIGTLGQGVDLQDSETGDLTDEAASFVALLHELFEGDAPYGIKPYGSEIKFESSGGTAWQVWDALMTNAEKAAARIYLGTDGVLGSVGGAPGVDIQALFGVATTIVQGDLACIERGIKTGTIDVWAAINYGTSAVAPWRKYLIPDADADSVRESFGKRMDAFNRAVKETRDNGFAVNQELIDMLATRYDVPAPVLVQVSGPVAAPAPGSADPDQDGQPGEPPTDDSAQRLADKMTEQQVDRCEHGAVNRCRLCGIERVRDFERDPETGEVVWKIAWRPIQP